MRSALATPFDFQAVGHVVAHVHVGEEGVILENRIDVPLVRSESGGFFAVDTDRAGTGLLEPGDQPQAGGLARAGWAQHGKELAVLDINGDPVNGLHIAELTGYLGELDCKRHGAGLQKSATAVGSLLGCRVPNLWEQCWWEQSCGSKACSRYRRLGSPADRIIFIAGKPCSHTVNYTD